MQFGKPIGGLIKAATIVVDQFSRETSTKWKSEFVCYRRLKELTHRAEKEKEREKEKELVR